MNGWIISAVALSIISPYFYSKSIFARKARPHKVTRLVVWVSSIASFLAVVQSTNVSSKIFALIFLIRASYLLLLSIFYGVGGATTIDKICLLIGIIGVILFSVTGSGMLAISFAIIADFIGYVPTYIKVWQSAESEDPLFFALEGGASILGIIAIGQLSIGIILPIYFLLSSLAVLTIVYRKTLFTRVKL